MHAVLKEAECSTRGWAVVLAGVLGTLALELGVVRGDGPPPPVDWSAITGILILAAHPYCRASDALHLWL